MVSRSLQQAQQKPSGHILWSRYTSFTKKKRWMTRPTHSSRNSLRCQVTIRPNGSTKTNRKSTGSTSISKIRSQARITHWVIMTFCVSLIWKWCSATAHSPKNCTMTSLIDSTMRITSLGGKAQLMERATAKLTWRFALPSSRSLQERLLLLRSSKRKFKNCDQRWVARTSLSKSKISLSLPKTLLNSLKTMACRIYIMSPS